MKEQLQCLIINSLEQLKQQQVLPEDFAPKVMIEHARNKEHGDFASNIAMLCAKPAKRAPRELAELIVQNLPESDLVAEVMIAWPGFINFKLVQGSQQSVVKTILAQGKHYGESDYGQGQRVLIEFVSANPTGPLHVGHGRGAAFGATLASLMRAVGYQVDNEYYVNDAGRQMHILAVSIWLRYLALCGGSIEFPRNGYKGDYVYDIAKDLQVKYQEELICPVEKIFSCVTGLVDDEDGKEAYIDALIKQAQQLLGERYQLVFQQGLDSVLSDIKEDLEEYGVHFERWFSEQSLMDSGAIQHALERLVELGFTYKQDGALWFKSKEFGDDKDRVLQRADGRTTYFGSDVAYHLNKIERGYDLLIDIWGADHHGYIARVRAAMRALGVSDEGFIVPLVQFASLYRDGEKVQMSTRSGSFVTLRELREEIGRDAARFFYVMRKVEQHMDFDLNLAKSKSNENPVFYIQYAHARICSVLRQLQEKALSYDEQIGMTNLDLLNNEHEAVVLTNLSRYPEAVLNAAKQHEPHLLVNRLRELANAFHTYYNAEQFIVDDERLRNARLSLISAVRQVLVNGLTLLGVSVPETM